MRVFLLVISIIVFAGCASSTKKTSLASDTGYLCVGKDKAKKTGFPNQGGAESPKNECIQIPADNDQSWDYQVREYERDDLPSMP